MSDDRKPYCSDEGLALIASGADVPSGHVSRAAIRLAAQELISRRSRDRSDSRRAQQLRKLRWAAEHILTKLDELGSRWRDEDSAVAADSEVQS